MRAASVSRVSTHSAPKVKPSVALAARMNYPSLEGCVVAA